MKWQVSLWPGPFWRNSGAQRQAAARRARVGRQRSAPESHDGASEPTKWAAAAAAVVVGPDAE